MDARLRALADLSVPEVPTPVAVYVPAVVSGDLVFTSGQLPMKNGELMYTGKVGGEIGPEEAKACAQQCALNAIAAVKSVVGDLDRIARVPGPLAGASVYEVGPGPGGLTRALLRAGARVTAVERDRRCLAPLAELAEAAEGRLDVIEGDALAVEPPAGSHIVANLPYNVGTELLVRWLTPRVWPPDWSTLVLMFQKEVAQRIVAQAGDDAYGRLAILAQWRCDARIVLELPPSAFVPPPKVSSAVVRLDALPAPRFPADPAVLSRVVAAGFNQRRKMLRSSLRGLSPDIEAHLAAAGIPPTERAERVDLERFCALARSLAGG